LGADQPGDIGGEHGLEHLQTGPDGQGEQALAGGAGKLGERDAYLLGQLQQGLVGGSTVVGILRHGGPLLVELLGGCPTPTTQQASGGDRHLNFYGNLDNLPAPTSARLLTAPPSWHEHGNIDRYRSLTPSINRTKGA
jgi:hypothetical protein